MKRQVADRELLAIQVGVGVTVTDLDLPPESSLNLT